MNKRICVVTIFILFTSLLFSQQYDTTFYNVRFVSAGESMWNSGPNVILPKMEKTYSFSWNESTDLGGVESVLGMDFGAELYGKTAGTIGLGYYMSEINGGKIDSVIYPINIEFMVPKAEYISAGQTIKISSIVRVDETQKPSIETTFPLEGKVGVNMIFDLETDLRMSVCAFDACLNIDPKDLHPCVDSIMDFSFNGPILELNTLNSNPRITVPDLIDIPCLPDLGFNIPCIGRYSLIGDYNYWPSTQEIEFFPLEFGLNRTLKSKHPLSKYAKCIADTSKTPEECFSIGNLSNTIRGTEKLDDFLVGSFTLPFIDTLYTTNINNNLYSEGADTAISMEFRPLNLIAGGKFHDGRFDFPIPCAGGSFYASYMLIRPTMNLDVIAKQDLDFEAQVIVSLELPAKLAYKVVSKNGTTIKSGNDDLVTYEVGNDLYIDFPCSYEYIDFKPTFRVQNKFTNRTYASINMDGKLQALELGIGLDEITVVPEIHFCIPNPFGDDWCTTIPTVTFGFDASLGPLVDESISNYLSDPEDLNIELDIFKDTWEINSFQEIPTPAFRVAPSRFVASVAPDTISCNGEFDGDLEVYTKSGTPPFSYEWSDNSYQKAVSKLPAGAYYVKVTDKNGCVAMNGTTVFEYTALEIESVELVHPECFGYSSGSITCNIKGGKPPYNYSWSNGAHSADLSKISAGVYVLTVTDQMGCIVMEEYTLTEPSELKAYVNFKSDVLCNGRNSGSIKVNVSGGEPGYDFYWSNGAISQNVDSLLAGDYLLTVVDINNCRRTLTETINEPPLLTAKIDVQNPISCYKGDDGKLFANINGGLSPYDIVWYNPQNTVNNKNEVLENLHEGLYQMEVYDANNCYRIDTLYLTAPQERFLSELKETHLSCNSANDGMFDLTISGGTPPFQFLWSDGSTEQNRSGLAAGQYKVTISDAKFCLTHNNMVLIEPFKIRGDFTMIRVSCDGEYDGSLEFLPRGGTPPYSFFWSDGSIEQKANNLPQGLQTVLLVDAKNCEAGFAVDLLVDGRNCFDIPNAFSPNGDLYNDTWIIKNISAMYPNHEVTIFTAQGNILYACKNGGYVPWDGKRKNEDVPSGTYYYVIDLGNGSDPIKGTLTIVR